jgi:Protein of unknown function (DUF1643)
VAKIRLRCTDVCDEEVDGVPHRYRLKFTLREWSSSLNRGQLLIVAHSPPFLDFQVSTAFRKQPAGAGVFGKMVRLAHDLGFKHLAVMNMYPHQSSEAKDVKGLKKLPATTEKNLLLVQQEMRLSEGIVFCWDLEPQDQTFIEAVSSFALEHMFNPKQLVTGQTARYIHGVSSEEKKFKSYEEMPTFDCEAGMGVRLGAPR